ncbi:hypothetical protein LINGRAHAP2_LOCUS28727 [Linum grandiflorum]
MVQESPVHSRLGSESRNTVIILQ